MILHNKHLNNTLIIDINVYGSFITVINDDNYIIETYKHIEDDEFNYRFHSNLFNSVLMTIEFYNIYVVKVGDSKESKLILNKLIDHFKHGEIIIFKNQIYINDGSHEQTIDSKEQLDSFIKMYMRANNALYKVKVDEDIFIKIIENISNLGREDFNGKLTSTYINEAFEILKSYNHLSNVIDVSLDELIMKYSKRKVYSMGFGKQVLIENAPPYTLEELL